MKSEAQRVAIAEFCGWKRGLTFESSDAGPSTDIARETWLNPYGVAQRRLPDYLNDLNAVHEAEMKLTDIQKREFCIELEDDIRATASQRAEALLKTIGKWDDSK